MSDVQLYTPTVTVCKILTEEDLETFFEYHGHGIFVFNVTIFRQSEKLERCQTENTSAAQENHRRRIRTR